jgi:uncharacterized membrane protein
MSAVARKRHEMSAVRRVLESVVVAAIVGGVAALLLPWQGAVLAGWIAGAALLIALVWVDLLGCSAMRTQQVATREDNSRFAAQLILLLASVASLVGTGFDLVKASEIHGSERFFLIAIALATVVVSWAVVHTVYLLRYAHEYYSDRPGGIDFKNDLPPDYRDFAYLAFTVGMTFQVSDTDIQSPDIRRTVLKHALLSFLFGAVILAIAINVVAGLLD